MGNCECPEIDAKIEMGNKRINIRDSKLGWVGLGALLELFSGPYLQHQHQELKMQTQSSRLISLLLVERG